LFYYRLPFLFDFLLWFLVLNIHNKIYPTLTGGEYLLNQLLLFNIFISKRFIVSDHWFNSFKKCIHNFACAGIIIQVCFIYLVAGLTKLKDVVWMQGEAVALSSQVEHYNMFNEIKFDYDSLVAMIFNYIILFYQLLFPLLIWFSKIKKPMIIFGIVFHLYVAFGMGLVSFGMVMLIPYIYLWPAKRKE